MPKWHKFLPLTKYLLSQVEPKWVLKWSTYILLITEHFFIQSEFEWVHKRVNFLPSLNSQKNHPLVGGKIPKYIFFKPSDQQ